MEDQGSITGKGRRHGLVLALALLVALPAMGASTGGIAEGQAAMEFPEGPQAAAPACMHGSLHGGHAVPRMAPVARDARPGTGGEPGTEDHGVAIEPCTGAIRPGARMTSPAGCTLNFVFRDVDANLYIGTAGHCVGATSRVSALGVGSFGQVVFRVCCGSSDFALIRIDADKHALVDPTMCTWGGPVGADPGGSSLPRDVLLEYGWGFMTDADPETRSRAHVQRSPSNPGGSMTWIGMGSGGDSGAPVVTQGGYAAAIHTFGTDVLSGWGVTSEGGPTFANILAAGRTAVPSLELVPGDPTDAENLLRGLTYP